MEQWIEELSKKRNDDIWPAAQIMGTAVDNANGPAQALQFLAILDNERRVSDIIAVALKMVISADKD
jgi:hypothetical protein